MNRILVALLWYPLAITVIALSFVFLFWQSGFKIPQKTDSLSASAIHENPIWIPMMDRGTNIKEDYRKIALGKFLSDVKSPLINQIDVLIREADKNGIDYALIPAIAMQESLACKKIPEDSYNCWGYGIYGKNVLKFDSYEQAIAQVAKTIKETYIKNGLTNPTLLEDRWAPPSRGVWSYSVNFFISKMREYEKNIPDV